MLLTTFMNHDEHNKLLIEHSNMTTTDRLNLKLYRRTSRSTTVPPCCESERAISFEFIDFFFFIIAVIIINIIQLRIIFEYNIFLFGFSLFDADVSTFSALFS